ncbi:hypothetical protein SIID45300_01773 [Candidatus Magnetaquicoccaceae bacterium FCR-1]|uniref:ORC1/DEAH AAA+ ATPase domain-containing protein n=1 Tax=Candidatus Magnetaquiglobus chichijimensis TaxID=3141448 RepID=A0ABQ0C999_9PROT
MKNVLVQTENVHRFLSGVGELEKRGAREASIMLLIGDPGFGKTECVERWADQEDAVYLCGYPRVTAQMVLGDLVRELGGIPDGRYETRRQQADRLLRSSLNDKGMPRPIILDEAQFYLENKAEALEVIRSLTDRHENSLVLVSMDDIQKQIAKYDQISSRIASVVKMHPANIADVEKLCDGLSEVKISQRLAEEILHHTGGRHRDVVKSIALAETFGKRNRKELVNCVMMSGEVIAYDWRDETPRKVREAMAAREAREMKKQQEECARSAA